LHPRNVDYGMYRDVFSRCDEAHPDIVRRRQALQKHKNPITSSKDIPKTRFL